jgi:hypothetical protein
MRSWEKEQPKSLGKQAFIRASRCTRRKKCSSAWCLGEGHGENEPKRAKNDPKTGQNGPQTARGSRAHRGGPRGPRDPPMVAPPKKSKVRSNHGKRLSGASGAETSVSEQKLAKTSHHMDFLRSSKTSEGTIQKTARTPGGAGCPSGILGEEGSVGGDLG